MSTTTVRSNGNITVKRTALGQVAEYDVYVGDNYVGGGSKREAMSLFNKLVRRQS